MALSTGGAIPSPSFLPHHSPSPRRTGIIALCNSSSPPPPPAPDSSTGDVSKSALTIGSPVIVVDAPPTLKTANSISCLRVNAGLVKPGDVGRIVARKPKDVWAVRLSIGTYLIDGKHFKPLDLNQKD